MISIISNRQKSPQNRKNHKLTHRLLEKMYKTDYTVRVMSFVIRANRLCSRVTPLARSGNLRGPALQNLTYNKKSTDIG